MSACVLRMGGAYRHRAIYKIRNSAWAVILCYVYKQLVSALHLYCIFASEQTLHNCRVFTLRYNRIYRLLLQTHMIHKSIYSVLISLFNCSPYLMSSICTWSFERVSDAQLCSVLSSLVIIVLFITQISWHIANV